MDNNNCIVCNTKIPQARMDFLIENGKEITCLNHSIATPVKGIYFGEHGTSELILCDRVYDDSVRSKFYSTESATDIADEEEEEQDYE